MLVPITSKPHTPAKVARAAPRLMPLRWHTAHSKPSGSCTIHRNLLRVVPVQVTDFSRESMHYGLCKIRNKAKPVHAATLLAQQTMCLTWERVMPPLLLLSMRGLTGRPISFSRSPCSCRALSNTEASIAHPAQTHTPTHIGKHCTSCSDTYPHTHRQALHILLRNVQGSQLGETHMSH